MAIEGKVEEEVSQVSMQSPELRRSLTIRTSRCGIRRMTWTGLQGSSRGRFVYENEDRKVTSSIKYPDKLISSWSQRRRG
jgi:hypothetical protein